MPNETLNVDRSDIVQVGLPEEADRQLRDIVKISGFFKDEQDLYKFAVGFALAKNMTGTGWMERGPERKRTKFSVSGLDTDGSMKRIITLLAPEAAAAPYRYSQWLATAGISYLYKELVEKTRSISDVLELGKPPKAE